MKGILRVISVKVKVNGQAIEYFGAKFIFPRNIGININSRLYWHGSSGYETITAQCLSICLKNSDFFIDIGSNFGFYSVMAQKVNSKIKVYCFEPLFNIYNDNLLFHKINGCKNQVVVNMAVGANEGMVKLYVPDVYDVESEITSASLKENFFFNRDYSQKAIDVKLTSIDVFFNGYNEFHSRSLVIKIDVEGFELDVLKGSVYFLKTFSPIVICEIDKNEGNVLALGDLLHEIDYSVFAMTANGFFYINAKDLKYFRGGRDFLLIPSIKSTSTAYFNFDQLSSLVSCSNEN